MSWLSDHIRITDEHWLGRGLFLLGLWLGLADGSIFAAGTTDDPTTKTSPVVGRQPIDLPRLGDEVALSRIKEICEHYGLHDLWRKIERDPPVRPFKSDGCTGWFDDWNGVSLYPAGFLHDLKYWAGYPGEDVDRLVADAELMIDVARLLGSTQMAETMFHGVRAGGAELLNAPFSWGFGRQPLPKTEPRAKPQKSRRSGKRSPTRIRVSGREAAAEVSQRLRRSV